MMKFQSPVTPIYLAIMLNFFAQVSLGLQKPAVVVQRHFGHVENWHSDSPMDPAEGLSTAWSVKVGEGCSQVVGSDGSLIVTSGEVEKNDKENHLVTRIRSLSLETGELQWEREFASVMFNSQETFSGATPAPQATPALIGDRIVALSFTGQLVCLDRDEGTTIWKKDLVKAYGATPVQYGFAASPVPGCSQPDQVCVFAAGKSGGLFCFDVEDGSQVWRAECETSSYATPVKAKFDEVEQWVIVTENEVLGIAAGDGKQLWQYSLPAKGLTNVPSPLIVDESRVLISGQGMKGTICLRVKNQSGQWSVEPIWTLPRLEMFYTNWMVVNSEMLVACNHRFLIAVNIGSGKVLGKWRGFSDANVCKSAKQLVILGGKGELSFLNVDLDRGEFSVVKKYRVLNERCWTPVSWVGDRMLVRGGEQLVCLKMGGAAPLENLLATPQTLALDKTPMSESQDDPVDLIFSAFQDAGQDAALELYSRLRREGELNEQDHLALVQAAQEQSLAHLTQRLIENASKDFPKSKEIQSALKMIKGK